jgi:hypothetical protein
MADSLVMSDTVMVAGVHNLDFSARGDGQGTTSSWCKTGAKVLYGAVNDIYGPLETMCVSVYLKL